MTQEAYELDRSEWEIVLDRNREGEDDD